MRKTPDFIMDNLDCIHCMRLKYQLLKSTDEITELNKKIEELQMSKPKPATVMTPQDAQGLIYNKPKTKIPFVWEFDG